MYASLKLREKRYDRRIEILQEKYMAQKDYVKDQSSNNENTMFCKYCGTVIDKDSKFCKHCGEEQ